MHSHSRMSEGRPDPVYWSKWHQGRKAEKAFIHVVHSVCGAKAYEWNGSDKDGVFHTERTIDQVNDDYDFILKNRHKHIYVDIVDDETDSSSCDIRYNKAKKLLENDEADAIVYWVQRKYQTKTSKNLVIISRDDPHPTYNPRFKKFGGDPKPVYTWPEKDSLRHFTFTECLKHLYGEFMEKYGRNNH